MMSGSCLIHRTTTPSAAGNYAPRSGKEEQKGRKMEVQGLARLSRLWHFRKVFYSKMYSKPFLMQELSFSVSDINVAACTHLYIAENSGFVF
jgi:hypothetical protein